MSGEVDEDYAGHECVSIRAIFLGRADECNDEMHFYKA